MINIFAGFEGVEMVSMGKRRVSPSSRSSYDPDLYEVMEVLQEVKKSVLGQAIILNYRILMDRFTIN